jgi:hypothetical protein
VIDVAVESSSFPPVAFGFVSSVVPAAELSRIAYEPTGVPAAALTDAGTELAVGAPDQVTTPFIPEQGCVAQKFNVPDGVLLDTLPPAEIEKAVSTVALDGFADVWVHATAPVAETLIVRSRSFPVSP